VLDKEGPCPSSARIMECGRRTLAAIGRRCRGQRQPVQRSKPGHAARHKRTTNGDASPSVSMACLISLAKALSDISILDKLAELTTVDIVNHPAELHLELWQWRLHGNQTEVSGIDSESFWGGTKPLIDRIDRLRKSDLGRSKCFNPRKSRLTNSHCRSGAEAPEADSRQSRGTTCLKGESEHLCNPLKR